ncbi:hypothetical protein BLNAU_8424 [Blattamonas nauphoetae]|uniref:Uncharacterized protein n=1 Tax=Blattamonas nauphoetae TaxID=2049346 RepID=A0ABQ9XYP7_9EUKA|nr:hypothetical protein BLNAU_8424 [Blattamonas nauphoetae]
MNSSTDSSFPDCSPLMNGCRQHETEQEYAQFFHLTSVTDGPMPAFTVLFGSAFFDLSTNHRNFDELNFFFFFSIKSISFS